MKSKTVCDAGICGFQTVVAVESEDGQEATVVFRTGCPNLKPVESELTEVDAFAECFGKIGETKVYGLMKKYCKHVACPVPSAVIKGIEVACGLALPKDATIAVAKE